mmetsp:Transcript_18227/g.39395  ORF Transcript_18227/g.39395 Transcript_18227/m.39395 type:complete len:178 (-) Transcript_18227:728-1261(-)
MMKAQLPGGIPIFRQKNTPELNQGELMRWAAEATLFPLALLPHVNPKSDGESGEEALKWLPSEIGDDNSAILELKHRSVISLIIFHFDPETHLVTSIQARRPRAVGDKYEMTRWEGFCFDYEIHGGLRVPTRMEVGWQLEDDAPLEIYFKATNRNFIYLMNSHPTHNTSNVRHEHVE